LGVDVSHATSLPRRISLTGLTFTGATLTLAISQAPLGTPLFFGLAAVCVACYLVALHAVWRQPALTARPWLYIAFAFAIAVRIPPAVAPVGPDNDMVRYLWDARVQRFGFNPYTVFPSDPGVAHTHTDETRLMPSRNARTPYPPAAQLFFRLVSAIHESARAMKLALVACDLLTMLVLWRWLAVTGRNEWLTLAYAWNPLVVLEVAHSGHIDALGALWITASAYWLARQRTLLASIAFVLAIASKLLPVVLAPLYWRRVRARDVLLAGVFMAGLYLPYIDAGTLTLGAVPNVVAFIRFNGPVFRGVATAFSPEMAAALAIGLGWLAAVWARWRLAADDPAAWAWPMAIALICAPVIYPWYLLYFTPFLFSAGTIPLIAWTISSLPVYLVWDLSRQGERWRVPAWVTAVEFGTLLIASAATLYRARQSSPRTPAPPHP
jgi:hypothetical protein